MTDNRKIQWKPFPDYENKPSARWTDVAELFLEALRETAEQLKRIADSIESKEGSGK